MMKNLHDVLIRICRFIGWLMIIGSLFGVISCGKKVMPRPPAQVSMSTRIPEITQPLSTMEERGNHGFYPVC